MTGTHIPHARLIVLLLTLSHIPAYSQSGIKVLPPTSGIYQGAFPYFGPLEDRVSLSTVNRFNRLVGKPLAWAYFSNNWFRGIRFPYAAVRIIFRTGAIPFVRLMPRANFNPHDTTYTLQKIIDGVFDTQLRRWATMATRVGIPMMAEFGGEPNGDWFPWCGAFNGGGDTAGYGDPSVPDGPERFRDAYRHIIDICRNAGAVNITWAFHVNSGNDPVAPWNTMAAYYPGDDYIDWIGESAYGAQVPEDYWSLLTDVLDESYNELASISPSKPLALFEYGVIADTIPGHKAGWITEGLDSLRAGRYPRIKGISYWHSKFTNANGSVSNMRLDSSPDVLEAYRTEMSDPFFVSQPVLSTPILPPEIAAYAGAGSYELGQNYPNPFNPTTTITYNLPAPSRVLISIYNALGQEVARLVDGIEDEGFNAVDWSPASDGQASLASGVYFCRLQATTLDARPQTFTMMRKMLYLK